MYNGENSNTFDLEFSNIESPQKTNMDVSYLSKSYHPNLIDDLLGNMGMFPISTIHPKQHEHMALGSESPHRHTGRSETEYQKQHYCGIKQVKSDTVVFVGMSV